MVNKKYILKEGIVLHPYGVNSLLDNSNLTDDIAEMLIKRGDVQLSDFIEQKKEISTNKKIKKNGNSK